MVSGRREWGLSQFDKGYERVREHLPLYESLGFALWSANNDADSALHYATLGLAEAQRLRGSLTSEIEATTSGQQGAISAKLMPKWTRFLDTMTENLKLQYSYFSALSLQDEPTARRYAQELYDSKKSVAEYQDVLGFVLMR
jgi:hypothetical protein